MLNRKQEIVILVSIFLLILSFLFPPWADFFPVGTTDDIVTQIFASVAKDEKMVVFVGYASLFDKPQQYVHEFHNITVYTKEAEDALEGRKSLTQKRYFSSSIYSGQDSIVRIGEYDSIIAEGTIIKKVNDRLVGFAGIYHELLFIQMALIVLISIGLLFVFRV